MRRIALIVVGALVLVMVLGAVFLGKLGYLGEVGGRIAESHSPGTPVMINDLRSESQLQDGFNANVGSPRLVLLFSPT